MVEDFLTRFADWAIPNSDAGRRYLISRGINPARIKVIYNGINLHRLTPDTINVSAKRESMGLPPGGMVVGITARLTPAKDPGTFLQAARIIHQAIPETRFGVLGNGPLKPGLENQARELGLAPYVVFFGDHHSDVGSYISAFDIACLSSKDIEGCSSVTVEAMSLGKPVVVTDVGGNKELVEHGKNGFLVPAQNPQALADSVIEYLRNPGKAREMGQYAKEIAHTRFAMRRYIQDYENLYESSMRTKRERKERT
jgi:glycosyltransferase involved in cell wall biosynthesis